MLGCLRAFPRPRLPLQHPGWAAAHEHNRLFVHNCALVFLHTLPNLNLTKFAVLGRPRRAAVMPFAKFRMELAVKGGAAVSLLEPPVLGAAGAWALPQPGRCRGPTALRWQELSHRAGDAVWQGAATHLAESVP